MTSDDCGSVPPAAEFGTAPSEDDWDLYALDALDEPAMTAMDNYLDACSGLQRQQIRAQLASTREAIRVFVDDTVQPVTPSPAVRARALQAADSGEQLAPSSADIARALRDGLPASTSAAAPTTIPPPPTRNNNRRARSVALAGAALAAAIVLVFAGILIGRATVTDSGTGMPPEVSALLSSDDLQMNQAEVSSGGTTSVMASRSQDLAVIMVNGVADPQPGHTYRVWMLHENQPPTPTGGVVNPAQSPRDVMVRVRGVNAAVGIGLTVATIGSEPQPDEPMIVTVALV